MPVCIYNNIEGKDATLLKQYHEPSWNNPVVRYVNAAEEDLIPRLDRQWSSHSLVSRMIQALESVNRPVPGYLRQLALESRNEKPQTATFAMHCYWVGEASLGALDGVLSTRAGWLQNKEVVEVRFDPQQISYRELLTQALQHDCADTVFARTDEQQADAARHAEGKVVRTDEPATDAKPGDQMHASRLSDWQWVPMTPMQRTRLNAALSRGLSVSDLVSPRQQAWHALAVKARSHSPQQLTRLEPMTGVGGWQARVQALARLAGDH